MQLAHVYLWLKGLHIAFMVTWFAGLFYLPRLFIYHAEAVDAPGRQRFTLMERRLFAIMTVGAVITAIFGILMLTTNPGLLSQTWFQIKLLFLAAMIGYHWHTRRLIASLAATSEAQGSVGLRWYNEVPVIFLLGIILLAVLKPFYKLAGLLPRRREILVKHRSPALRPPFRLWRQPGRVNKRAELVQCSRIHSSLEVDHLIDRSPKFDPAPSIELRVLAAIETHAVIGSDEFEDKPALFLANTERYAAASHEFLRKPVLQPVTGRTQDFDVSAGQTDFLMEFAIHGFFRAFSQQHAALRKLPAAAADASGEQQFAVVIRKNDTYVRPKAV